MDEFTFESISVLVEMAIVAFINAIASFVNSVANAVPNPDPFPPLIENLVIDDGSIGAQAFFFINQFVDIGSILGILFAWFPMFAMAWIFQMLWTLAKAKNKG